jgi:hypothetical protein
MSGFDDLGRLTFVPALYRPVVFPFFAEARTNTRLKISLCVQNWFAGVVVSVEVSAHL